MDLLDAGILGDRHQLRRLAPALGVDVDEGRERPSHRLAVEAGHGAADSAGLLQLLYPLVHGRRRKVEALAQLLVGEGRSEEHTYELQARKRNSSDVFGLNK